MLSIAGIDSRMFYRGGYAAPLFKANMGVSIIFPDNDSLKEKYNETFETRLQNYGIKRTKRVYSSYRLMLECQDPERGHKLIDEIFSDLIVLVDEISIFYTYFLEDRPSEISLYGIRSPEKKVSPIEFIETILSNSYPHLCAFQFESSHIRDLPEDCKVYIDNFEGEVTRSWLSLRNFKNFYVLPKGDECNAVISASDIALRAIDDRLYKKGGLGLYPEHLKNVIPEVASSKIRTYFLSEATLRHLVPIYRTKIDVREFIKHPIVFFLREESPYIKANFIERTPIMDAIHNLAYELDGTPKMFDATRDQRLVTDEDYFVYMGPEGKKATRLFRNLGYKFKVLGPKSLMEKYRI